VLVYKQVEDSDRSSHCRTRIDYSSASVRPSYSLLSHQCSSSVLHVFLPKISSAQVGAKRKVEAASRRIYNIPEHWKNMYTEKR
jgi:hypothetical protein